MALDKIYTLQARLSAVCTLIESSDISSKLKQELTAQATVFAAALDDFANLRMTRTPEGESEMLDAIGEFCTFVSSELSPTPVI